MALHKQLGSTMGVAVIVGMGEETLMSEILLHKLLSAQSKEVILISPNDLQDKEDLISSHKASLEKVALQQIKLSDCVLNDMVLDAKSDFKVAKHKNKKWLDISKKKARKKMRKVSRKKNRL